MIFVTIGNATQGFRRLLDAIEGMACCGFFENEEIVIQVGNNSDFKSACCTVERFLPMDTFVRMIGQATLVICHAGAGTLLQVLRAGKVPVVMPRRQQYRELVDDHQVDLVKALASEGRVVPAYEAVDLPGAISEARRLGARETLPAPTRMLSLVANAIDELTRRKRGGAT